MALLRIKGFVSNDNRLIKFDHKVSRFGRLVILGMVDQRNRHFSWEVHLRQNRFNNSCNEGGTVETTLVLWN